MELIELLNEEGFGVVAGELLTEISLGREVDDAQDQGKAFPGLVSDKEPMSDFADERGLEREPIPLDEQLPAALSFLRLRLIEPVRQLADAERLAGDLLAAQTQTTAPAAARAVRISFRPVGDSRGEHFERSESAGQTTTADELDQVLNRLLDLAT